MGQPSPDHLQGKSLRPALEQKDDVVLTKDVFIDWDGPEGSLGNEQASGRVYQDLSTWRDPPGCLFRAGQGRVLLEPGKMRVFWFLGASDLARPS